MSGADGYAPDHSQASRRIRNILIVGGGTAGWMAAAFLARSVGRYTNITVVEAPDIPTVGVGEATIPPICDFVTMLGVDEDDFIRRTKATFKLGIEFVNWGGLGERYIHPFGKYGFDMEGISFHHFWLKALHEGDARPLEDYSFQAAAARAGKFTRPLDIPRSPLSSIAYAYHFDAALVAQYLRDYAVNAGVQRVEGKVTQVGRNAANGHLASITLDDGTVLAADLFIDCSGFRGLLIEGELAAGYEDWSHWLPCDRAVAVPCAPDGPPLPYTRATAHGAGWQWRIALQDRVGNGHVYASEYLSGDEATAILMRNLDGEPLADPRVLRFTTGRRRNNWVGNCVSLGLAAGFMEPLESTSIHLVQSGLTRLMAFFPTRDFEPSQIAEYNRRTQREYEFIRDFLVLHYSATKRDDTPFWDFCRTRALPPSLQQKVDFFRTSGHVRYDQEELFKAANWLAVLTGQGITSGAHHPVADMIGTDEVRKRLAGMLQTIAASVDYMPDHAEYIREHCRSKRDPKS